MGGGAAAGGAMGQGILFDKGFGQHILKNPLVVQAIVDKVRAIDLFKISLCSALPHSTAMR
jgi:hypothetical protein